MTLKKKLETIGDDLLDICETLPDAEARKVRKAIYQLEDVRTSQAVGELIDRGARQNGYKKRAKMPFTILRGERAA